MRKLVAALTCRNELGRYLPLVIEHLRGFCDQIVIADDGSDDGTAEWLWESRDDQLQPILHPQSRFFAHEGKARQALLEDTFARQPSHVLSIDCDEFVADGEHLRDMLKANPAKPVWTLQIEEVWKAGPDALLTRQDGGWRSHELRCLWTVPARADASWRFRDRRLAVGRVPIAVQQQHDRSAVGTSLLHFGWAAPAERRDRYQRYVQHDGGRFHANTHLKSIMWPENKIRLTPTPWPEGDVFTRLRSRLAEAYAS